MKPPCSSSPATARRGLSLHAHYTYAHAMDWNPNESTTVAGSDVLDPADFSREYGTSNLDVRHSAAAMLVSSILHGSCTAGRPHRQRLDALRHRPVPQRPALHHAHLRLAAQRSSTTPPAMPSSGLGRA